jgi:hypothetical protein
MYFIDRHSPFRYNFALLLLVLESYSFSSGGSLTLLLFAKNLGTLRSYIYSFGGSSASMIIVFSDLTFLVLILKLAEDSISFPAKHTVFLPVC